MLRFSALLAAVCAVVLVSLDAHAFTYESALSPACHEQITGAALRAVRSEQPPAEPIAPNRDERALMDDVPFNLAADFHDVAAVSLLLGVRDNDLKGRGPAELDQLALVHGDPNAQREHCLRSPSADGPGGDEIALRECRAFILERINEALAATDASGVPDPNARLELRVDLQLRGKVDAVLPIFWVRVGQAIHALQDGFSHTYRTADGMKVIAVLDWIDFVDGDHDDARDGPAHSRALDRCDETDDLHNRNKRLAAEASTQVLSILLDRARTREQKVTAVNDLLDTYFSYEPGCTSANQWCNAPEVGFADSSACACSTPGVRAGGAPLALGAGAAIVLAMVRRKRRATALLGLAIVLVPSAARAQDPTTTTTTTTETQPANPPAEAAEVPPTVQSPAVVHPIEKERLDTERVNQQSTFKLAASFAGGFVDPAIAGSGGARLALSDTWMIGLDGEANAWYGVQTSRMRLGSVNVYASLIARWPLRFEPLNLRSTIQLGTAIQALDLYGVPSGNVGLFGGIHPLGIEWKVSKPLYIIFNPLGVVLPATQLSGAPFAYTQFRTTIGIEVGL